MSQRRNTFLQSSRSRYTAGAALVLAGLAACSADQVSGPAAPAASTAPAAMPSLAKGAGDKEIEDAAKRLTDGALTTLAATWHTTSADIEAPTTKPLDLTCSLQGTYMVSQRIGRSGGTLRFGRSELRIPSGALASDVQISATITLGGRVNVDFAPHGLKFAKAAELRVDWAGCTAPSGSPINLYYTDDSGRITQVMPSAKGAGTTARMLTDHFSGFSVGWGRQAAADSY